MEKVLGVREWILTATAVPERCLRDPTVTKRCQDDANMSLHHC